jgi:ubiquitin-conjugating enzyme E2 Z
MNNSAIKRILFDRKLLLKNPLDSLGIYIIFDDDDVYSAKALIIGPRDTPYHMGYYLFDIKFPDNYPFSPPKVKLETLDPNSKIRLNPNLYTNGKVCLSILNTWSGPKWNPCQNISSVLISIQSILNENPLHNEPGWENETGSINEAYNNIITHENFNIAIINILENTPNKYIGFLPIIRDHFINNYKQINESLSKLLIAHPKIKPIKTYVYSLSITLNYKKLIKTLENLFISYGGKIEKPLKKNKKKSDTDFAVPLELQIALDNNNTVSLSEKDKSEIKDEIKKNINQKKYERKSPNEKAKNFDLGYIAVSENDQKKYIVYEDKNNVKKWKQYKEL